ncbi:MAG: hypothetical protein LLF96_09220 [Eubacteriales bacterium]|nr:hypothetical protein [Eubacteriales bacterium]
MEKKTGIRVGIGFATGRRNFLKVLNTYIYNWEESGLTDTDQIHLQLFIAYDLKYNNAKPSDFTRINASMAQKVDGIRFVDADFVRAQVRTLIDECVIDEREAELFFTSGYAAMRNAVLYAAVRERMDYLLFLDDDEYPLAVTKSRNTALWSGQNVLAEHLRYIQDADVTNGFHCGYISPIPQIQFNDTLTEADFQTFIEAISNDIINWDNIARVMRQGGVTYADTETLVRNTAVEVPEINHCKFISGSNLCLNLTDPGRVYPFYNPPGARGEDTFLSTCLSERKVLRIPCYAFHDGFSIYNYLLSGVLPVKLKPIGIETKTVVNRFYNACIGWVRYKPLLTYITKREEYDREIRDMEEKLAQTLPKLNAFFGTKEFTRIMGELGRYDRKVETHYAQFMDNQRIWKKLIDQMAKQSAD